MHDKIREKYGYIEVNIPFNSTKKNSIIAIRYDNHDRVRVFVKGAPEALVRQCTSTYDLEGQIMIIDEDGQHDIIEETINQEFGSNGLRSLGFAYRDYTIDEFKQLRTDNNDFFTEADREVLLGNLRLIAIFALEDHIRPEVKQAVKLSKAGKMDVRLVSGDNLRTTLEFAIKANIITREEVNRGAESNAFMTGD